MAVTLGDAVLFLTADDGPLGNKLQGAKQKVTGWASGLGGTVATLAGGAVIGGATAAAGAVVGIGAAAISTSSQIKQVRNNIVAELGATEAEAERLGDVAVEVFKDNFAGSIEEATAAVVEARKQLGDLSDAELQDATENAFRLADTFNVDVGESLNAVKTLTEQFGLSQQEAFDFITSGFQKGLNASGDFLDSIGEYGPLFASGNADAGQFFSTLETGQAGGVLGTDKIADAFKEFQIRFVEGNKDLKEGLGTLGLDYDQLRKQVEDGSITMADVFGMVTDEAGKIDSTMLSGREALAKLGTQFEDLDGIVGRVDLGKTQLEDLAGATDTLDAKYANFGAMFEGLKRKALVALAPIGDKVLDLANRAMPHVERAFSWFEAVLPPLIGQAAMLFDWLVSQLQTTVVPFIRDTLIPAFQQIGERIINEVIPAVIEFVTPIIQQVIPGLQLLGEIAMNIASVVFPLLVQWWNFLIDNINIIIPILAVVGVAIAAIQAPILLVIGVIVLLATAWANNWGGIQEKTQAVLDFVMPLIQGAMAFISETVSAALAFIQQWWADHGESVMTIAQAAWDFILAVIDKNIKTVQLVITTIAAVIQAFWDRWGSTIMTLAQLYWENITIVVKAAMDLIGFIIDAVAAVIEGDWQAFGDALLGIWRTVWDAVQGIVENAREGLVTVVSQLIDDIIGAWDAIEERMREIGANIIEGIRRGIEDGWDALIDFVSDLASSLFEAAQDALQISSPSRLFETIGRDIQMGLALGLTDNQGLALGAMQSTLQRIVNNNQTFNQVINTNTGPTNTFGDFQGMQALLGT